MTHLARECGSCTLCCKVFDVAELQKPMGSWCPHCTVGSGCQIYQSRPQSCRDFQCAYLADPTVADIWEPTKSRIVLYTDPGAKRMLVRVDPARPDAWRREPYYSQLKAWSRAQAAQNRSVTVFVNRQVWVVLPDKDVSFGELAPGEVIVTQWVQTPAGLRYEAFKRNKDVSAPPSA